MIKNKTTQAILAVITGNAIFGFSFLFSKIALMLTIPSVLIATRFTVAFLTLNVVTLAGMHIKRKDGTPLLQFSLKNKPKKDIFLLALFQPVIYFLAENYGIVYTSSAFAGVIIAVIPVTGILFDIFLMHAKVERKQIYCAMVSILGVVITTWGAKDMSSSVRGVIMLLIAVVAGSLFYVFSKKAGTHYNSLEKTYMMFGIGSLFYIILALIQCRGSYGQVVQGVFMKPVFWVSIAFLAIFSSVIAFLLLNFGSNYISVSQASLFANLTTVISIIAGVLVLHEKFTLPQIIGAVLILGSVYLASGYGQVQTVRSDSSEREIQ